jgi:hypothetical protein
MIFLTKNQAGSVVCQSGGAQAEAGVYPLNASVNVTKFSLSLWRAKEELASLFIALSVLK